MSRKDKEVATRMAFLRDLFATFGVRLVAHDPGILGHRLTAHADVVRLEFDGGEWQWLEPLLVELRERRAHDVQQGEHDVAHGATTPP